MSVESHGRMILARENQRTWKKNLYSTQFCPYTYNGTVSHMRFIQSNIRSAQGMVFYQKESRHTNNTDEK
jgi:hypothetical protein